MTSDFERLVGPDRRRLPRPRGLAAVVAGLAVVLFVGLVVLWPFDRPDLDVTTFGLADEVTRAEVSVATAGPCSFADDLRCLVYQFTLDDPAGETTVLEFPDEPGQPELVEGDRAYLAVVRAEGGEVSYQYAGLDRRLLLGVLALVFGAAVVALGRVRGFAALISLALSITVLIWFILPAIVAGRSAVLVAVVGGGVIALISLYLAHGPSPLTHVAAVGVFGALVLTALLSWITVSLAGFTGLVSEEAFLLLAVPDLDLSGLLLAGVVLGALGALDDVTVTQASAVWEVRAANPRLGSDELYASGLRVGRDHIVSTVNTLLLAYAGASLPLLIFFTLSGQSFGFIASSEVVAVEIVRTLVGSVGLVAAVPITTWLAARVAAGATGEDEVAPGLP